MTYGVINKNGKIEIITSQWNEKLQKGVEIKQDFTIEQARALARDIYAYCRIAEKERKNGKE